MSASDPWAAFPVVQADPPQSDPWAAFPVVNAPQSVTSRVAERLGTIADNTARTLARGATLGFADEIAAAGNATVGSVTGQPGSWSERYTANLGRERQRDREFDARNPVMSLVGQAAGGIAAPLPVLRGAASLPGAMVRGAATGAGYGAVAGFGAGEGGPGARAVNAAEGAVVGAGIGAGLPVAMAGAAGAGSLASRLVNPASRNADAERLFLRDLSRDGVSPQELLTRSRQAGDAPVALVDLAGENVRGSAQAVARMPGEGQRMASELLAARSGPQQTERLRQSIREAVSGEDFAETTERVIQRRRQEAAPNYERAYAVPLPADTRLQSLLADPDIRRGVMEGVSSLRREALARDEPFDLAAFGVRQGENGALELIDGAMPTRLFDAAKRGLDGLEESARAEFGRATSKSREIASLRNAMLSRVDELNPDYAAARAAYAGDSALLSAAKDGRRLATQRPEDFEMSLADIRAMSPGERDFFRMGVARGLVDRINSTADGAEATRMRQLFGTPFIREKLAATFDNPADFQRFAATMEQEIGIASTNRAIDPRGGSPTMPLAARRDDLASPPRSGASEAIIGGANNAPVNASQLARNTMGLGGLDYAAVNLADQLMRGSSAGRLERNSSRLAQRLFAMPSAERSRFAEDLIRRSLRDAATGGLIAPIAQGGLRAGGVVGGQTDTPLMPRP